VRSRPLPPTCLRSLLFAGVLSAGVASILLAAGCLNPQPDDFPQSRASSPSNESAPQGVGPADIVPGGTAVTTPSPQAPADNLGSAPPPGAAPVTDEAPANAGADAGADAGAPAPDGGLPDAAPVVTR
jgi:hypothetical protein